MKPSKPNLGSQTIRPTITNKIPGLKPGGIKKPNLTRPGISNPIVRPEIKPLGPLKPLKPNKPNLSDLIPNRPIVDKIPGRKPNNNKPEPHDHNDKHKLKLGLHLHLHRPICLPPIVRCPPPRVCPPCVLAICPQAEVVYVERTTEQILGDFLEAPSEPAFVIDLQVDTEVTLEVDGLTDIPGALVLDVNGIGLPVEILGSEGTVVSIKVPSVGLSEAQLGKLYVLNADLQLVAAVDARLHPAVN